MITPRFPIPHELLVVPGGECVDECVAGGSQTRVRVGDLRIGAEADASASKIKMTEPDVAARMILDGMESNAYRVMVGSDAKMLDRLSRFSPLKAATIMYKQM